MSKTEPKKPGKSRGLILTIAGAVVIAGAGAAGGAYAVQSGLLGTPPKAGGKGHAADAGHGEADAKGGKHKYFAFEQGFTSNLKDGASFVQLALSIAGSDEKAVTALKDNEAALRSVVLMTVAEAEPAELGTKAGKQGLQLKLRDALGAVMREKTGQSGIVAVYLTGLVIQ